MDQILKRNKSQINSRHPETRGSPGLWCQADSKVMIYWKPPRNLEKCTIVGKSLSMAM